MCAHTCNHTYTHTQSRHRGDSRRNPTSDVTLWCLSLLCVCLSPIFSSPYLSRPVAGVPVSKGEITLFIHKTHNTNKPSAVPYSAALPFPVSEPPLPCRNEKSSAARQREEDSIFVLCFFFMSDGKITSTKEGHSEERVVFRVSELNKLYFSSLCFLLLLLSSSLSSILASPRLSFMYFCLVFSSPLTCSHRFLLFSTCRPENSKPCHANRLT